MKKKSLLFFYVILFLISCKKNESVLVPEFDLSGNYVAARSAVVTSTKMYVKGKIITDWKSINDFVISNQFPNLDVPIKNVEERRAPDSFYFNLSIKENKKAIVDYLYLPEYMPSSKLKYEGTITIENDELTVRAPKADTIVYWGSYEAGAATGYSITKAILPKTKYKLIPIWSTDSQVRVINTKRSIFVIKDNEIFVPMLGYSYKKVSGQSTDREIWVEPFFNIGLANPELSTAIGDQDTVVIQEYRLKLIKQN
ncbi:MAG: hypothetical protein V4663_07390 [Bacteroidota bacterium]